MSAPRYQLVSRPSARATTVKRARQSTATEEMLAAQQLAGNAAVSAALAGKADEGSRGRMPRRTSREDLDEEDRQPVRPVRLLRPSFDLHLAHRPFQSMFADGRVTSERDVLDRMRRKRGRTRVDWTSGTGETARKQKIAYRSKAGTTTFRGALEDFDGLEWQDLADPTTDARLDVGRIAPGTGELRGRVRVHLGHADIVRTPAPVQVAVDGAGSVRLVFAFSEGSLTMTGRAPLSGSAGLDWEYQLDVATTRLAAAIWQVVPRPGARGGGAGGAAGGDGHDPPDDPPDDPSDEPGDDPADDPPRRSDTTRQPDTKREADMSDTSAPDDRGSLPEGSGDLVGAAEQLGESGQPGERARSRTVRPPQRVVRGAGGSGLLDESDEPARVRVRSVAEELVTGAPVPDRDPATSTPGDTPTDDAGGALAASARAYLSSVDEHGLVDELTRERRERLRHSLQAWDAVTR